MTEPLNSPPAKKSRLWLWIVIGVVVVLCVGGLVLKGTGSDDSTKKASSTTTKQADTPVNLIPEPLKASSKAPGVRSLTIPAKLTGYAKFNDPQVQAVIDAAVADMKGQSGVVDAMGGVYGNPAKGQLRMFIAAKIISDGSGLQILAMEQAQSKDWGVTPDLFKVASPGPLGGNTACADGKQGSNQVAVCVWADTFSTGAVYFVNTKLATAQTLFLTARGEIELMS